VTQLDYHFLDAWHFNLAAQIATEKDLVITTYPTSGSNEDHYVNRARSVETLVKGSFGHIAGQEVQVALGSAFRAEGFGWTASYAPSVSTRRNISSVFGEVLLPLLSELTLDLSGRYDGYSDFGRSWDPKAVLLWRCNDSLSWHTNYSRSFKSPTLYELYSTEFAEAVAATSSVASMETVNTLVIDGGNRRLTPERSRSIALGLTYEPEAVPGLKIDVSGNNLIYRHRIDQLSQDGFVAPDVIQDAPVLGQLVTLNPTQSRVQQALNTPGLIQYTRSTSTVSGDCRHRLPERGLDRSAGPGCDDALRSSSRWRPRDC